MVILLFTYIINTMENYFMMTLQPGMKVKHYKGNVYKIILIGYCSETKRKLVVYDGETSAAIWIRPYDMFNDIVQNEYGEFVPRFTQII